MCSISSGGSVTWKSEQAQIEGQRVHRVGACLEHAGVLVNGHHDTDGGG